MFCILRIIQLENSYHIHIVIIIQVISLFPLLLESGKYK